MLSINETSSKKVLATIVALSALGLTTTLNSSNYVFNTQQIDNFDVHNKVVDTATICPIFTENIEKNNYQMAMELFDGEMRDFTQEEQKAYQESLDKIYKPIGVNIWDIC